MPRGSFTCLGELSLEKLTSECLYSFRTHNGVDIVVLQDELRFSTIASTPGHESELVCRVFSRESAEDVTAQSYPLRVIGFSILILIIVKPVLLHLSCRSG